MTTIHDAIKILSELTEADLRSRLDQLAAEQQAAKVLLRAVVRRDQTFRRAGVDPRREQQGKHPADGPG